MLSKNQNKKVKIPGRLDKKNDLSSPRVFGFIFQSFNLIPVLNVYENIEFPLLFGSPKGIKEQTAEWIDYLMEKVGLTEWKHHKSNELSGGQRQHIAIVHALVAKLHIVLADESTANLDSELTDEILSVIKTLATEKMTMVIVTHEMAFARDTSSHIIFMDGGAIVEQGSSKYVIDSPKEARTKTFLARFNA